MNKGNVLLLLNGEPPKKFPKLSDYEVICATDGAYHYLNEKQIIPDFISGDFDSIENLPKKIEVIHTPNQSLTDFDKVLQILSDRGYKTVHIYGASGKEQDHFLGNLHTAIQWKDSLSLTFFDNYGSYFLAKKKNTIVNCKEKIISLIPFPKATKIKTKGFKYSLNREDLTFGKKIGTRNTVIENKAEVHFETGELFIFINDSNTKT